MRYKGSQRCSMAKVITCKDIRENDVIEFYVNDGIRMVILTREDVHPQACGPCVQLHFRRLDAPRSPGVVIIHQETMRVLLVHRPWPDGKTEADMLEAVETAIRRSAHAQIENDGRSIGAFLQLWHSTNLSENLTMLREAIETYELGKPQK
jgi:hypothetical protein